MAGRKPGKQCPVCGHEYGDDAAFCMKDGSKLEPAASAGDGAAGDGAAGAGAAEAATTAAKKAEALAAMNGRTQRAEESAPVAAPPERAVADEVEAVIARAGARGNEPVTVVDPPTTTTKRKKKKSPPRERPAAVAASPGREPVAAVDPIPKQAEPTNAGSPAGKKENPLRVVPREAEPECKPDRRKRPARSGGGAKLSGAFARFRNPWMTSFEKDAPTGIESAVQAARAKTLGRRAQRKADGEEKPFSETLWFLEGAQPDEASRLEEKGAVERDDGHYSKKSELPQDLRSRYTLDS